jgi:hypothetical protein
MQTVLRAEGPSMPLFDVRHPTEADDTYLPEGPVISQQGNLASKEKSEPPTIRAVRFIAVRSINEARLSGLTSDKRRLTGLVD